MFEYRQALAWMRRGESDRDIGRSRLMGRRKCAQLRDLAEKRGWLKADAPLPEDAEIAAAMPKPKPAASTVSSLEKHRDQVAEWIGAGVQGTTIHAKLARDHGWRGSYSAVRRLMRSIRSTRPVPATMVLDFRPAEAAQVDFGAGPTIKDAITGESQRSWFFVMTLCWSRHQYAELVRDQSTSTWLACHRHAFEWFGGVPGRVIVDNAKCAITEACMYDPVVQRAYAECAEAYGFRIEACPPRDPAKKGIVESGVKYIKGSFLPLREFRSFADANQQLRDWMKGTAGVRSHGTTREQPLARFAIEKPLMRSLPDVTPDLAEWAKCVVNRTAHVQHRQCWYSIPHVHVGRTVWLRVTATIVKGFHEHELVATHPRLSEPGARSTVQDHLPLEARAWSTATARWCQEQADGVGPRCGALVAKMLSDPILDRLRAVQKLLRLRSTYETDRIEAACARADDHGLHTYRGVKQILASGLDSKTPDAATDVPASLYSRGGRFLRAPAAVA